MADIVITPANVIKGSNAITKSGIAGEAITAGQTLYIDTDASNVLKLGDAATGGTELMATVEGVALHGASTGQPVKYQTAGSITIGGTVTVGEIYLLSTDNAGGIATESDVTDTGDFVSIVGVGTTTAIIALKIFNSSAQIP